MVQRKQLGLFFSYNENWIGGTYYILNLVHALNLLDDLEKPHITILGHRISDFEYIKKETSYPYLAFEKDKSGKGLWQKAINAFSLRILKKELVSPKLADKFDLLFPAFAGSDYLSLIDDTKKVDWIPDFQDFHLPHLYTPKTLVEVRQRNIAKAYLSKRIVLSSEDAAKDFSLQYLDSKAIIHVIPFSVTHPDLSDSNFEQIQDKYAIKVPYFYAPNQYWSHKNHSLIIKAVNTLKQKNKDILVLFSGKEWDPRSPEYVQNLKKLVVEQGLEKNIKFLGFLDRTEQLLIMQHALAIIQPSLFEGWSTVIEDSKALNKFVFASDLAVHKEQLSENVTFFDAYNPDDLANRLNMFILDNMTLYDYKNCRIIHAKSFIKLFNRGEI